MKFKSYKLTIALLAIVASVSATSAWGETPLYGGNSNSVSAQASSEELAELAAELARTAAKLAEAKKAQTTTPKSTNRVSQASFEAEAARRFSRPAKTQTKPNTVRWMGTEFEDATVYNPPQQQSAPQAEMPAVFGMKTDAMVEESGFSYASDLSESEFNNHSQVSQSQAYAETYQPVRRMQHTIPEPADSTTPSAIADDNSVGNPQAWSGSSYGNDACCDSCCDSCCDTCCDPCCGIARCPRRRTLVVGTEAVFLGADINGTRASYFFEDYVTPLTYGFGQAYTDAAVNDFYIAPRLSLGVQGECWGVMGRYFHLRAGEHAHDQMIPAIRLDPNPVYDEGFDANSLFEAYYTDIELTRNCCLHGCKNQFSFGVRYAEIEHHESIYGAVEIEEGLLHGGARANRRSSGTGLTFGLNGRKPLFCNSCAHWFYNARSSILWGCTKNEAETWAESIVLDPNVDAIAGARNGAVAEIDDDLFIGEVQVGIEWDFALRCLPAKSFFRVAFEYQYWDASAGHAGAGSFAGLEQTTPTTTTVADATTFADAPGLVVDLYGFHVGTGFTW